MSNLLKVLFTHYIPKVLSVTSNKNANLSYEPTNFVVRKSFK